LVTVAWVVGGSQTGQQFEFGEIWDPLRDPRWDASCWAWRSAWDALRPLGQASGIAVRVVGGAAAPWGAPAVTAGAAGAAPWPPPGKAPATLANSSATATAATASAAERRQRYFLIAHLHLVGRVAFL